MDMARVALITGGAQGLGAAIARRFLQEGFSGVVLLDRSADKLAQTAEELARLGRVQSITADLMDEGTAHRAVSHAVASFGRLDVLVNAAGNTERCGILDATPQAFDRVFDVNVKAPFFLMQEAARVMVPAQSGIIINVASMLAYGGPANLTVYAASKAALVALTRNAANSFKRQGVRAYCINLGWAKTDGEHALQTGFHGQPEDWAERIGRRMPFGRLITPDDVAGLAAFLVSPAAQMMTGAAIDFEQMPMGVYDDHPALAPDGEG